MPAMFFMDDEAVTRMNNIRLRLEKLLDREIPDEEDIFFTFEELLNMLDKPHEEIDSPFYTKDVWGLPSDATS